MGSERCVDFNLKGFIVFTGMFFLLSLVAEIPVVFFITAESRPHMKFSHKIITPTDFSQHS